MATLSDVSESILHEIISVVIDLTKYKGWQLSLRLVNFAFNEAVLHVFYVCKRLVAEPHPCTIHCKGHQHGRHCRSSSYFSDTDSYAARFNIQTLLAREDDPRDSIADQYSRRWKTVLKELRSRKDSEQLRTPSNWSCPVLSNNPIFNDDCSAILASAIHSVMGRNITHHLDPGYIPLPAYRALSVDFWMAMCACIAGDSQLLDALIDDLKLQIESCCVSDPLHELFTQQPAFLLEAATYHTQVHIIHYLLNKFPNSAQHSRYYEAAALRAAIFSRNEVSLRALIESGLCSPASVASCLKSNSLLIKSDGSIKIIKSLMGFFSPLPPPLRKCLIRQSIALGDVNLLEELSTGETPFNDSDLCRLTGHPFPWSWMDIAVHFGNADVLKFLLDHAAPGRKFPREVEFATRHALKHNQIKCYELLYERFELGGGPNSPLSELGYPRSVEYFESLGGVDGAMEMMKMFISRYGDLAGEISESQLLPRHAPYTLLAALVRLRPDNVQFLLKEGVRLPVEIAKLRRDVFETEWPYFNMNKEAFARMQEILHAFGLPKLRIVV